MIKFESAPCARLVGAREPLAQVAEEALVGHLLLLLVCPVAKSKTATERLAGLHVGGDLDVHPRRRHQRLRRR